jgi:hypothetical protein
VRRAGGAGFGAGGAGKAGAGSRKVKPRCGDGDGDGAWLGRGLGATSVVAGRTGAGGGKGRLADGDGGGVWTGGGAGTEGKGCKDGKGASTTLKGLPSPARSPGIPNCSDNSSACSSSDTSKPPASRRFDGASLAGTLGTVAGIAMGMVMLMAAGNIV